MPNEKLNIWVNLKDNMSRPLRKMGGVVQRFKQHWLGITIALAGVTLAFRKLARTLKGFYSDVLKASDTVEQMETKLKVLLGSTEEGNKAFENMRELASKVPFEFEEIMKSATDLAGVVEGGNKEIKKLMPIIADIAAGTGLSIQLTTQQMIRMYGAGAAAADTFRDRGISAALGFQQGVSYTNEETMRHIIELWENGTAKFVGATEELAKTWTGTVSMMKDAWFNFQVEIGTDFFDEIKKDLQALYKIIQNSKEEGGEYAEVIEDVRQALVDGYEAGKDFMLWMLYTTAKLVKYWHSLASSVAWVQKQMTEVRLKSLREALEQSEKALKNMREQTKGIAEEDLKNSPMYRYFREGREAVEKLRLEVASAEGQVEGFDEVINKHLAGIEDNIPKKVYEEFKRLLTEINEERKDMAKDAKEEIDKTNASLAEQATLWEKIGMGIEEGLGQAADEYKDFKSLVASATNSLVDGMESEFGNFFYNVFTGQLDDAAKIFENFGNRILKTFSNMLGKMAAQKMVSGILGIFGGPADPTGSYNVGFGAGSYPGGYSGMSGLGGKATGGDIPMTGNYLLHRGEKVTPANEAAGKQVTYNIYAVDPQSFQRLLYQNKASIDMLVGDSMERNSPLREQMRKYGR